MKRVVCLLLCAVMLLGLLPAAALADAPQESEPEISVPDSASTEPGEPVLLEGVSMSGSQLYLGIGHFTNDGVKLARDDSFTAPSTGTQKETYSVILWKKSSEKYSRVGVNYYNKDDIDGWEQLSDIKLSMPGSVDGGTNAPTLTPFVDEYKWTDYYFGFDSTTTGKWEITASCTLGEKTYQVSCYVTVQAPADPEPGEPIPLPGVSIDGWDLYLGIGRFDNDGIKVARSSSFIAPSSEWNWGTYSVILWTKNGDNYERVGVDRYNGNNIDGWGKLSDITLSAPQSTTGNESTPEWQERYENGWPDYRLGLDGTMTGTWKITASFKLAGTEHEVSCYITRKAAVETKINAGEVGTLDELNAKLKAIIEEDSTDPQWYYIYLPLQTYEGTVVIPKEGTNSGRKIVYLCGNTASNGTKTTINGGIRSDNDLLVVQNIHFTGAGMGVQTLSSGEPNYALYGSGKVDSDRCTFEGYDKAMVWEGNRRLFGRDNTYQNNNIAWYVDLSNGDVSGSTQGVGTTFENNSCAIYVASVGSLEYTGKITDYTGNNVFRNNVTDIRNDSGRPWFMPANYFVQTDGDGNETLELKYATNSHLGVSCYPMRKDETFYYDYKQNGQDAQSYLISNYDASLYRTPAANLDGKIFEVIDPVRMTQLALFSFPSPAQSVDTSQTAFDATVWVNRSGDQIILTMKNPGRRVYVKVPCDASSGTITHNGQTVEESGFDGYSAWFWTSEGGEYVITMGGPHLGRVTGCATVEEINTALENEFARLNEYRANGINTIFVQLSASEYTGQIVVPALPEGFRDDNFTVRFEGTRSNNMNNVTLYGGICSNSALLYAANLNFVGAGKDKKNWPTDDENAGAENTALYGDAMGMQGGCSFTGYYYAVKMTEGIRPCGADNTYTNNHVAWYIGKGNNRGGYRTAVNCDFIENDIAIQATNFSEGPSFFTHQNCRFINNTVDVKNNSGRTWCIPGNYFAHSDSEGNEIPKIIVDADAASPVSCFPMYNRNNEQFYYVYEQEAENYIISNNLAGRYPIPQEKLTGKTFKIVDEDADQTLATLIFNNSVSNTTDPFNATVRVERVDSTIGFTINSIGRNVTVELPCAFEKGTVTGSTNGKTLENVEFNGQTVSFTTGRGDIYMIKPTSDGEEQFQPGVPKSITVTIDGKEKTCWFGVGEFINGRYTVLTGSYMGAMSIEDMVPRLAVGLWWENGPDEFTMLSPKEAAQVQQQADFSLKFQPLSAAPVDPPAWEQPDDDELATKMPAAGWYRMKARHEGNWRVVATCTMKNSGETYTAYGEFERGIINYIDVPDCKTVGEINAAVQTQMKQIENSGTQRRTQIRVIMEAPEYTGQIVVPSVPDSIRDIMDGVTFEGHSNSGRVTLYGGIRSDDAGIYASNISFIGAGKENPTWPADGDNAGAENAALYGAGGGSEGNCVFTGYYYAIKMAGSVRLCGTNNHFKNNHIAWYVEYHDDYGGNPNAERCVFEENDIAIQIEKFSDYLPMSFYAPGRCEFIDNELDVQLNQEKIGNRTWFIPGNYFVHTAENGATQLETRISPATAVSFYPMRRGDQFYYDGAEWGATNGILLSNSLTSAYPTPKEYLDGKTFAVVGEDNTTTLATFAFTNAEQQSVRRAARRSVQKESFDATVSVERTEDRIVFAMNDPCRPVTVTLPRAFTGGTVTHNGKILNASFADGTVSFKTNEGGTYEIHASASTHVIAAGYNALGQLVGVQILSSADARANIPNAATIKIFTLDSSYRPIAECETQTNK